MFISLHQKHVLAQTVSQGNRSTHARERAIGQVMSGKVLS